MALVLFFFLLFRPSYFLKKNSIRIGSNRFQRAKVVEINQINEHKIKLSDFIVFHFAKDLKKGRFRTLSDANSIYSLYVLCDRMCVRLSICVRKVEKCPKAMATGGWNI